MRSLCRGLAARAGSALACHGAAFACRAARFVLVAGIAGSIAAGAAGLLRWPPAPLLAAAARIGLLYVSKPEWRNRPRASSGPVHRGDVRSAVLSGLWSAAGLRRKFSLRGQVRPLAEEAAPICPLSAPLGLGQFLLGT